MKTIQKMFRKQYIVFLLSGMIFFTGTSFAGGLYPEAPLDSTMYTMDQLWDLARLRKGHIPKIQPTDAIGAPWPVPRFIDNNNGTITDQVTGLVWLKDISCLPPGLTFADAIAAIDDLNDSECGLSDDSVEGDWRMPNLLELISLIHYGYSSPALPNKNGDGHWGDGNPFTGLHVDGTYWTSTVYKGAPDSYFTLNIGAGNYQAATQSSVWLFWPVRGGR